MKGTSPDLARVQELLDKLEQRAHACRGLFPVSTRLEFLTLASDHHLNRLLSLDMLPALPLSDLQQLSLGLERFWRDPSLCPQTLAQALLRHRSVTLKAHRPDGPRPETWLQVVQSVLSPSSETACQNNRLESA